MSDMTQEDAVERAMREFGLTAVRGCGTLIGYGPILVTVSMIPGDTADVHIGGFDTPQEAYEKVADHCASCGVFRPGRMTL